MNIILTGMMGSGKTTVAQYLHTLLGWQVYDSDEVFVREYGAINTFFTTYGEQIFRTKEEGIIAQLCQNQNAIISLGGGAVLSDRTRSLLSQVGQVVYLQASPQTLADRLQNDKTRPLLPNNEDRLQRITSLLQQRQPLYEQVATVVVQTDGKIPQQIAQIIIQSLGIKP